MGLASLIKFNQWSLTSLDLGVLLFLEGQFQPEGGADVSDAPVLADGASAGASTPVVQFIHAGTRSIRFRSAFYSLNMLDDLTARLDALEALGKVDQTLGRPPRVAFTWGGLHLEGFAHAERRIVGWWALTGWAKGVEFTITVTEALPLDVSAGGSSGTGETQYLTLARGETFETLGARYLGSALKGELIRRENPRLAAGEQAGDRVKVLEADHPRMKITRLAPTAPPFLDRTDTGATWQPVIEDLAASRGVTLLGTPWDLQDDVIAGLV
jgi:hypothetical protein